MNIQDWYPLGWTGWLSLQSKGLSIKSLLQHHSSKASVLRRSAFFRVQLSHPSSSPSCKPRSPTSPARRSPQASSRAPPLNPFKAPRLLAPGHQPFRRGFPQWTPPNLPPRSPVPSAWRASGKRRKTSPPTASAARSLQRPPPRPASPRPRDTHAPPIGAHVTRGPAPPSRRLPLRGSRPEPPLFRRGRTAGARHWRGDAA